MAVGEGEFDELPSGSIIVKDNFEPDSTMASVTVMYKVEGYAPDAGDWFWAKYGPEGEVQASGHAQACLECHSEAAADHDYLMTAMAGQGGD
ncbi:MAG: cytochrome P460 family protein, partial [Gemmatimonadota bacterium]